MIKVKEMMVPLSDYATVSQDADLYDAVLALEASHETFNSNRYRHRAILILDGEGDVVGKVDMMSILSALEPKYEQIGDIEGISRSGLNPEFLKAMVNNYSLWDQPLKDICVKAARRKVKYFMYKPTSGEYIDENEALDHAIHMMVLGKYQSLLVKKGDKTIGILRLTDVFAQFCEFAKTCEIENG